MSARRAGIAAIASAFTLAWAVAGTARGAPRPAIASPSGISNVDIEENLGARVPSDLVFTDAAGKRVRLGDLFDGARPVVLVLAYYRCPMLCDLVLGGISRALRELRWTAGREYRGITVSIDPKDRPAAAGLKQTKVLQAVGQTGPEAAAGWPFLVGDEASIHALAGAVGFRYVYDPRSEQFAHPAVAIVLTPDGRVSRYLYGVSFRLLDLRLALTEAARGRVGTIVDRLLLTCFRYDPSARRYGFYVSAVLKGGASLSLLALGLFLVSVWRRDARRARSGGRDRW